MEILSRLLRRLGMPGSRGTPVPDRRNRRPMRVREPIQLSSSEREQMESRIAEFIEDSTSVYAHAHGVIARANALPLYFGWTALIALRMDGQIVMVPYEDEPGKVEVVQESAAEKSRAFPGGQAPSRPSILIAEEAARCD